jgi:hypothetical protein
MVSTRTEQELAGAAAEASGSFAAAAGSEGVKP